MDTAVLQDGFSLYIHSMAFDEKGRWAIIQQGMDGKWARRYHWSWEDEFFRTRSGIISEARKGEVLNLSSGKSEESRKAILDILGEGIRKSDILALRKDTNLLNFDRRDLRMPINIDWQKLNRLKEMEIRDFRGLVMEKGVGPKTVRALALIAKIVYGAEPDWEDPVDYTYAHGGKDGVPYPVSRKRYDSSIRYLRDVVEGLDIGKKERLRMLARIDRFVG